MPKKPIIIGVTGGSGGGKTSVSRAILSNFPDEKIAMIEHDSYYKDQSHLTFEERVSTNYDHPFAFDTDLMIEHINELIAGRPRSHTKIYFQVHAGSPPCGDKTASSENKGQNQTGQYFSSSCVPYALQH